MANGGRLVRFTCDDGSGSLGDGQGAPDTLIGDTSVGAFETVTDADVTENIIGQVFEQPHRIHQRGELTSERLEVSTGCAHEREKLVTALVIATARSGEDTGALIESRPAIRTESVTMSEDPRLFNGRAGGVKAEEVGSRDELVELSVFHQRLIIHGLDLGSSMHRPSRCIPVADESDSGAARLNRVPDCIHSPAHAAHRAKA
jgi:hypothetical protein